MRTLAFSVLRGLAWSLLAWAALHALATFLGRFSHPFQLEWSEGTTFLQAVRLLRTGELYTDPWSSTFVPHLYGPLHTLVLAAVLLVAPASLAWGRALSLGATLAAGWLLHRAARAAGASRGAAWLAPAGLLAAAPALAWWYDLVRVDALFGALFAGSSSALVAYLGREPERPGRRRPGALVGSALLLVAAALTKQTALAYGPAFALGLLLWAGWRPALLWAGVAAGALGASLALLGLWSGGWSWYYMFTVLGRHPGVEAAAKWEDLRREVLPLAPVLLAALAAWVARGRAAGAGAPRRCLGLLTAWGVPFALYAYLKHGGFSNAWLPLLVTALPATAALAGRLRAAALPAAALTALLALGPHVGWGGAPLRCLLYQAGQVPLPGDARAQEAAVAAVRAAGRSVWCPDDAWITFRARGEILPLLHLVGELMEGGRLPAPLEERLRRRGFDALLFSESALFPGATSLDRLAGDPRYGALHRLILAGYDPARLVRLPWPDPAAGYPRVGLLFRPAVLLPRREP